MASITQKILDNSSDEEVLAFVGTLLTDALKTMKLTENGNVAYQAGLGIAQIGHAEALLSAYRQKKFKQDIKVIL